MARPVSPLPDDRNISASLSSNHHPIRKEAKTLTKRIISLFLAVILLCTPAAALDLTEYEQALKELKNSKFFSELFDNAELKNATQQLIENFRTTHEDIKSMSDEELRQFILDSAAQYHIPEMNEEQIQFLMDVCRSLESAEELGETVKNYEQKMNDTVETAKNLFDTIGKLIDKLNEILETLNTILDKFGLNEESPSEAA